jgi:mono/diheme cytochrome c family protein
MAIAAFVAVIVGVSAATGQGLYFERCGACHGPAGQLTQVGLAFDGDVLRTRRAQVDLREFLRDHRGGLAASEIETVVGELRRVAQGRGRFQEKCGICHPSARTLARNKLVIRDGTLVGRYTGRDMGTYLAGHGRIAEKDIPFFIGVLTRVLRAFGRD